MLSLERGVADRLIMVGVHGQGVASGLWLAYGFDLDRARQAHEWAELVVNVGLCEHVGLALLSDSFKHTVNLALLVQSLFDVGT